jgi:hypothetical protein
VEPIAEPAAARIADPNAPGQPGGDDGGAGREPSAGAVIDEVPRAGEASSTQVTSTPVPAHERKKRRAKRPPAAVGASAGSGSAGTTDGSGAGSSAVPDDDKWTRMTHDGPR